MAEWSTFRTRSPQTIKQEVAVGRLLVPSETSQDVLCPLLHPNRCEAPSLFDLGPLTMSRSYLGDLQYCSILPIIPRLLLSTKADHLPLPRHLHDSLSRHPHFVSSSSHPEPFHSRQPIKCNRIHTRRRPALFCFISPPRAGNRQPCPSDRVEGFQRSTDYAARSMSLGY